MTFATPMFAGLVAAIGALSGCVSLNHSRLHAGLDDDRIRGLLQPVLRYEMGFDAANTEMEALGLQRDFTQSYSEDHCIYPVYKNGFVNKTGFKGAPEWPEEIELKFDDLDRLVGVIHRDGYLPSWRNDDATVVQSILLMEGAE